MILLKKIIVYCLVGNTDRFRPSKRHHKKTLHTCVLCSYKPDNLNEFSDGDMVRN